MLCFAFVFAFAMYFCIASGSTLAVVMDSYESCCLLTFTTILNSSTAKWKGCRCNYILGVSLVKSTRFLLISAHCGLQFLLFFLFHYFREFRNTASVRHSSSRHLLRCICNWARTARYAIFAALFSLLQLHLLRWWCGCWRSCRQQLWLIVIRIY